MLLKCGGGAWGPAFLDQHSITNFGARFRALVKLGIKLRMLTVRNAPSPDLEECGHRENSWAVRY